MVGGFVVSGQLGCKSLGLGASRFMVRGFAVSGYCSWAPVVPCQVDGHTAFQPEEWVA